MIDEPNEDDLDRYWTNETNKHRRPLDVDSLPDKALSVRQPWAHAIVMGWKPIENREWKRGNPGLAFRGPVAIHASTGMTREEYEEAVAFMRDRERACPRPDELARGGIVGVAVITDVVKRHGSSWFTGPVGLVIAEARPIDFIQVGGDLGFFDWKRNLEFRHRGKTVEPGKWMREWGKTLKREAAKPQEGTLL